MKESEAFTFIQRTAMSERTRMREVAERIMAGTLRPLSRRDEAAPARRQLADLPRVLRPADRHGHGLGPGHQRRLRVHVDVHQPAEGPPARRCASSRSTGPSRRSATRPTRRTRPTATAAPDILRQQMGLVREVLDALGVTVVDLAGWEADDIIATVAEQAKADGHEVIIVTGDRDSVPARRRPARQGALQPPRRQRLRAVRRGRHQGEDRRHAGAVPAVRGAARRPERQPRRRARRGGEDRGQADQHLRRARRDLRQRRRADAEAARHRWPSTRPGCGSNPS